MHFTISLLWEGFFKRLICIAKSTFPIILETAKSNFEEQSTVLTEIESVIKTRLILYLDNGDTIEAITPSHLMISRNLDAHLDDVNQSEFDLTQTDCT